MKKIAKNRGLVLKTSDYKENAVIACILTAKGKQNYIIRGAKKLTSTTHALAGIATYLEFNATENFAINTLTEGIVKDNFSAIKENTAKMQVIYAMFEKILVFSDQATDKEKFLNFVLSILSQLKDSNYLQEILALFELKLMYILGIAPQWNECTICKHHIIEGLFSVRAGGVMCSNCGILEGYELDLEETKAIKYLYLIKMDKVNKLFFQQIQPLMEHIPEVIDLYYSQYYDFQSKAKTIIKKIS